LAASLDPPVQRQFFQQLFADLNIELDEGPPLIGAKPLQNLSLGLAVGRAITCSPSAEPQELAGRLIFNGIINDSFEPISLTSALPCLSVRINK
jgi:hypothetical protein